MRRLAAITFVPLLALGVGCGGDDDDVSAAGGGADFCERATGVDAEVETLEAQLGGDEVPSGDVFDQAADAIGDLADNAPSEIEDDLETFADGVAELAVILGDIDLNDPGALSDPANDEKLEEMSQRIGALDQSIGASIERVERYLADECGIDARDDGGSDIDEGTDGTEGS